MMKRISEKIKKEKIKRNLNINNIVHDRRIELNFSQEYVACICGMTTNEYADIEDYNDELYMVVPLKKVILLCSCLIISLEDLYGIDKSTNIMPKNIIQRKLIEKKISVLELSNIVGIEENYIKDIMFNIVNIDNWVMDPVIWLADKLEINLSSLLSTYTKYKMPGCTST